VSHAIKTAAQNTAAQSLQVHVDLSGQKPTIPMKINPEQDIVYLRQPMAEPSVWSLIAEHHYLEIEEESFDRDEDWPSELVHKGQTEIIQHVLLPYNPERHRRKCAGCHKLRYHVQELCDAADQRLRTGKRRARRGCTMCQQVEQQLQLRGISDNEVTIRQRLLRERMSALLPQMQSVCTATANDLDDALANACDYILDDDDDEFADDDAASICSYDGPDDFTWYNNSRQALVVEIISRSEMVSPDYINMPVAATATDAPPSPRPSVQVLPADTVTAESTVLSCVAPFHYSDVPSTNIRRGRATNGPPWHYPRDPTPRHGSHPDCNRVRMIDPFHDMLDYLFPSANPSFSSTKASRSARVLLTFPSREGGGTVAMEKGFTLRSWTGTMTAGFSARLKPARARFKFRSEWSSGCDT
jgi:hypothetical protein